MKTNTANQLKKRWDDITIQAQIKELERLLAVLPSQYDGKEYTFGLRAPIQAQLEVLRTGAWREEYRNDEVSDSAFWAVQWLYRSVPGMFDECDHFRAADLTEEWRCFERLCEAE